VGISVGALIMRVDRDSSGQMSIDFLIGIMIFILAFLFLMMAIPQMFTPFQSNSDELTMIADRVASMLVETKLTATNDAGESLPGIVDVAKIKDLKTELDVSNDVASEDYRKSLGLDYGADYPYHLQVLFQEFKDDGSALDSIPDYHEIPHDNPIWPGSQNVGQSRRFVYVRDSTATGVSRFPGYKTIMVVRVW
jgi:hypothetical protein